MAAAASASPGAAAPAAAAAAAAVAASGQAGPVDEKAAAEEAHDEGWRDLKALRKLLETGQITPRDYEQRKRELVDRLTGTQLRSLTRVVVNRPPPDFSQTPAERAIKFEFDVASHSWRRSQVVVKIEPEPFARGTLRLAYHLWGLASASDAASGVSYVAKIAIDPAETRQSYLDDVATQMFAGEYARRYNSYDPPKHIQFIAAWVLELVDRPGRPFCAVERFVAGEFRKHNNNYGFVSEDQRNTPQAFSHFTYEASRHQLLVCDIQGVSDFYTDPQICTLSGQGFGRGNVGAKGFKKFLSTHRCNAICRFLRLPSVHPKGEETDIGTRPAEPVMPSPHVEIDRSLRQPAEYLAPFVKNRGEAKAAAAVVARDKDKRAQKGEDQAAKETDKAVIVTHDNCTVTVQGGLCRGMCAVL